MKETFKAIKTEKQKRHAEMKQQNTQALLDTEYVFEITNKGECLVFREFRKPRIDFYPSTGRWRDVGESKTYRGGAEAFVQWYLKQYMKEEYRRAG